MSEKAKELLKNYAAGKKIAVAVSGGRDSMCLLHLVLNCPFIDREQVVVVNVDHGIRAVTSARDSKFVKDYCRKHDVKCLSFCVNVTERCRITERGEEEEAREARREIFAEVCLKHGVELVLTAHHRSDNAETVLLNILRGSGVSGLVGMKTVSDIKVGERKVGELFRPLLNESREDINEYVRANGIEYVEDESNEDVRYRRNFVRKKVMPLLNERFNAEGALVSLAKRAERDDEFINKLVDGGKLQRTVGGYRLPKKVFYDDEPVASRYALMLLRKATSDYSYNSVKAVMDCARLKSGGKREIDGGLIAANEYDYVTLYRPPLCTDYDFSFALGAFDFGIFTAKAEKADVKKADIIKLSRGAKNELERELYIDADKLPDGARIRSKSGGETFEPFGGGEKKLKCFLIDEKIPLRLRGVLPLLIAGGETLAVFGAEISPKVCVDESTKSIVKLTLVKGGSLWKE